MSEKGIVVFGFTSCFPDDLEVECQRCGAKGVARPHNVEFARQNGYELLCLTCGARIVAEEEARGGEVEVTITEQTERELEGLLRAEGE